MDKSYDRTPTLRSRDLRTNATGAERRLWTLLRNRQLDGHRFNRQVPIGPYIADFVCRAEKLIVELDGGQHAHRAVPDQARTRFLHGRGYRVIRFWNNEVMEKFNGVMAAISQALTDRPSPNPSRLREGNL